MNKSLWTLMTGILTITISTWTASNDRRLMDETSPNSPIKAANTTAQQQVLLSQFMSALKKSKDENTQLKSSLESLKTELKNREHTLTAFIDLGSRSLGDHYESLEAILKTPEHIGTTQESNLKEILNALSRLLESEYLKAQREKELNQTEKNLAAMINEHKTKQLDIKNLEEQYTELDEQVKRKQIQIEELKEEAKKLKKAKTQEEKARAEPEKKEDSFTKKLKDRIRELEYALHQTQSEKEAIQDQKQKRILQKLEEEKTELQNKLDLLEAGNKGFKETLEKRQKETSDLGEQQGKIKEELQKKEQELQNLLSRCKALEETNKALQTTSQQNKEGADKMTLSLKSLEDYIQRLQLINQKLTTAEQDRLPHQPKQESFIPEDKFVIESQKAKIESLEKQILSLKTEQTPILDANTTLMENFEDLKSKNAELEKSVSVTRQHLGATTFTLNSALKKAESEKQELVLEIRELKEKVKSLEAQISEVEEIKITYLESVGQSARDFQSVRQENESLQKDKGTLETEKKALEQRNKELEEKVKQAETSKNLEILLATAQMKQQLELSSAEALKYKMELESQKRAFALMQKKLDMKIEELSLAIYRLETDHEKAKSEKDQYFTTALRLIDEKKRWTQSLNDLDEENKALKAQIQDSSQAASMVHTEMQRYVYVPEYPQAGAYASTQQPFYSPSYPVGYTPASPGFQGGPYPQDQ
ncbi:MAG: hypothetical protein ACK5PQ_03170 [Alphaproteobacteria bacterium]